MGKLYQNKWAGHETYFTPCFPVRTRKNESDAIGGYEITNVDGKWKCRKGQYYLHTMRDEEHFPVVGEVKINVLGYVMDTMLNALERRTDEPERKPDTIQKFHDYQVEWLKSHYDIELEPQLEEMIIRFLHDTANCYMKEEGGQNEQT